MALFKNYKSLEQVETTYYMKIFQMALLLLFEKSDSLNYKELHATTKMSDEQFPRYVQSLIDAKLLTSSTEVSIFKKIRN